MPYLVETFISREHDALRNATRAEHVEYLTANRAVILAAGAKLDEDGSVGDGTFYLLDVATRAEAERFITNDPYGAKGLIDTMKVSRVRTAFFDGQRRPS